MTFHFTKEPQAKDVMESEVNAIETHATVREAAQTMRNYNIRQLVVVSENVAIGMLVDRDITHNVVAADKSPAHTTVNDIMEDALITADEHDAVSDIARAMIAHGVSRVPVVRDDQLVGLITYQNLLRMWPGYVDVLKEELELSDDEHAGIASPQEQGVTEGHCNSCENYSIELTYVNDQWLCPECAALRE